MRPEVVVHNSVSLDGCATGFEVDLGLHYRLAGRFRPGATLVGSGTALAGLELFGEGAAAGVGDVEAPRPDPADPRPLWVLVDSRGRLQGKLHTLWASGFCRGLLVAVSRATPARYLEHLRARRIPMHRSGTDHVDLRRLLAHLGGRLGVRVALVDAGPTLVQVLLAQRLVDRLSLLVAPRLAATPVRLLGDVACELTLTATRRLRGGHVHLEYAPTR